MAMNPARCYHSRCIRGHKHDLARTMSAVRAMLLLPNELSPPGGLSCYHERRLRTPRRRTVQVQALRPRDKGVNAPP